MYGQTALTLSIGSAAPQAAPQNVAEDKNAIGWIFVVRGFNFALVCGNGASRN